MIPSPTMDLTDALDRLLDEIGQIEPSSADVLTAARQFLEAPIRVAVAGRVSSGKSTLVNALLGTRVAATAARELTAVLTVFRHGIPQRAVVHMRDGRTQQVAFPPGQSPDLTGLKPEKISRVEAYLPEGALLHYTLIDTPGLGSAMTAHAEATETALLGDALGGGRPDLVLYLARDEFRDDDDDFLTRLHESLPGSGGRGHGNVLAVLSHADNFGHGPWGVDEPLECAAEAAAAVARRRPDLAGAVAIAGLLAETSRTGQLREGDIRVLRGLAHVPDEDLQFAAQLGPPSTVEPATFSRLQARLGGYGIRHGRAHATTSRQLFTWLEQRSGISGLQDMLRTSGQLRVLCVRVEAVLQRLQRMATQQDLPEAVETAIERARSEYGFLALDLWRASEELAHSQPHHPLLVDIRGMLSATPQAPRSVGTDDREGLARLAGTYQETAALTRSGAEAMAARNLARATMALAMRRWPKSML